MNHKLFRCAYVWVGAGLLLMGGATAVDTAPQLLQFGQMISQRYGAVNDLSAKVQFDGWSKEQGSANYQGQVFFMRPNLFRVDYAKLIESSSPETKQRTAGNFENILVINSSGKYKWDDARNQWAPVKDEEDLIASLLGHVALLASMSTSQFTQIYNVQGIRDWKVGARPCLRVDIAPKPQTQGTKYFAYQKIDFDTRSLLPLQAKLEIPNARKVSVAFEKVQINKGLTKSVFGMED